MSRPSSGASEADPERTEVKHAQSVELRFSSNAAAEFNGSAEGRSLAMCFFFLALFYMWPYQTMMQTQSFLVARFPEKRNEVGSTMMLFTTWPMFVTHTLLSLSGLSRSIPYRLKVIIPAVVILLLSIMLVGALHVPGVGADALRNTLYIAALVGSLAESFVEPAVYELAGLLPSGRASQMVQAGNGACGLAVSVVQMLTRLVANGTGPIGVRQLSVLTTVFLGLMGLTAIGIIWLYAVKVQKSQYVLLCTTGDVPRGKSKTDTAEGAEDQPSEDEHSSGSDDQGDFAGGVGSATLGVRMGDLPDRLRDTREALVHVWPTLVAVALTFGTSLVLWPVIPGLSCVVAAKPAASSSEVAATQVLAQPDYDSALQSWWFDIVILLFNASDFLGKCAVPALEWGAQTFGPGSQLAIAVIRAVVFVPLVFACCAPQMVAPEIARWLIAALVFALGASNGWLSTVCFMRAPKALPAGTRNSVAEQASSMLVMGLFFGISFGCLVADRLAHTILSDSVGTCHH